MNAPIRSLPPESERLPIAAASSAASGRTAKTASSARSTGGSNTRPHISSAAGPRPVSGGEFVDGLDPRPDTVEIPARADGSAGIVAELSKAYVDARLRSSGVAAVLLDEAIRDAAAMGATALWLGTHERNRRAQKAYKRRGFRTVGSRIYDVGGQACRDVVMSLNPQEVHDEH